MICPHCSNREATVFLKAILNNKIVELALCAPCAEAKGFELRGGTPELGPSSAPAASRSLKCQTCGFKYAQFKSTGLLGCPDCYKSFREPLAELLQRVHGASRHRGDIYSPPKQALDAMPSLARGKERQIKRLRDALEQALKADDFENAARLRDALKALEP